jgi:hypothetical protein
MPKTPSRNDGGRAVTGLALCGNTFTRHGRRRFCDDACHQAAWCERHPASVQRVPSYMSFDYLIGDQGDGLQHFLEDYDQISREAVNTVLDRAKHVLTDPDNLAA